VAGKLASYRRKRDFSRTAEPAGGADRQRREQARFVVQEHHARRLHWDFRLERGGVLVSWAVPRGIPPAPRPNHLAVHVEDHPLEYIDFEGEIAEGNYGAGQVTVWDSGTYETEKWQDNEVKVVLHGARLQGRYVLFQTDGKNWMIHRMDPPQQQDWQPLPESLTPMMARLAALPAGDREWAFEYKWDGERALAFVDGGRVRLMGRTGRDITPRYPELRALGEAVGARQLLLDGELVALDEKGRPSFQRMQLRMGLTRDTDIRRRMQDVPVAYIIFDLLHLDGRSLLASTYRERRKQLATLKLEGESWWVPPHSIGEGAELLRSSRELGQEGVVAKRLDSVYEAGRRSGAWLKIKNNNRQEFVIGGFTAGEGRRQGALGALLVGYHSQPKAADLIYAGKVGTGYTDAILDSLGRRLAPLKRATSPFTAGSPPRSATFVEPQVVAEIEFLEWTRDGTLRAPSFKGVRDDKPATEVVREDRVSEPPPLIAQDGETESAPVPAAAGPPAARGKRAVEVEVGGQSLKLSNLDKVLYPDTGFTKAQVIDYYTRVAPALLPHLQGRALTLKRYPDGVRGQFFFEKNAPVHRPSWVHTATLPSTERGTMKYIVVDDLATLTWVANLASLELHTGMSLAETPDRPTMVVFDLDPGEGTDMVQCCEVGLELRRLLLQLGLESVVKTSGSKGLQAYVPLNPAKNSKTAADSEAAKAFSLAVADELAKRMPALVVTAQRKELRKNRVLVDWSQNDRHKTTVCVYSLRARESPTVSTPVSWDEVESCLRSGNASDLRFGAHQVLQRVAQNGDLFSAALELRQKLPH
jgi:bifunctional non-homologous end joining protein LigD